MFGNELVVGRTGTANLASITAALRREGVPFRLASQPDELPQASALVLPGVGSFGTALLALTASNMVQAIRNHVQAGRPLLAICLGLQLLCESSEESPNQRGLDILPYSVRRFSCDVRAPQIGWNRVYPASSDSFIEPGYAYFANSFCLREPPDGWDVAWSSYGGQFVASIRRGPQLACQFHPELSGPWGASLLRRWLCQAEVTSC